MKEKKYVHRRSQRHCCVKKIFKLDKQLFTSNSVGTVYVPNIFFKKSPDSFASSIPNSADADFLLSLKSKLALFLTVLMLS
jgi:hypothetical protein